MLIAILLYFTGIIELTNGLFALVLFCMILIMVSFTAIVSTLNERIRQLSTSCAMYEKRIRELERQTGITKE